MGYPKRRGERHVLPVPYMSLANESKPDRSGQDVDLLRQQTPATPSRVFVFCIKACFYAKVKGLTGFSHLSPQNITFFHSA